MFKNKLLLLCSLIVTGFLSSNVMTAQAMVNSLPVDVSIDANGQTGNITITPDEPLTVTVKATAYPTFAPLEPMDWWVITSTPFGLFSYDVNTRGFTEGFASAGQVPLLNDGKPLVVLDQVHLPLGSYHLYFGADLQANGALDVSAGYTQLNIEVVPTQTNVIRYLSNFKDDIDGWVGGFADLPVDADNDTYELTFGYETLPAELDMTGSAPMLQGHNRSDDLFMFMKRAITGLKPNTNYQAIFTIDVASNAPIGAIGIGGATGEAVYLKAGVSVTDPILINNEGNWQISLDKGNQSVGGTDMMVLGDIAVETENEQYKLKTLTNPEPFKFTTDSTGMIWLVIGTDSGFEGLTRLYYPSIKATFAEIIAPQ
ncbi:hypothetical protein [Beggiatoa leptomitoformis]|uniref:Uncharacterized protein n=1 Tax=Beggiatoa leptomitoformis TaxID=288004 RepID=A0A2N9YJF7_9GAMM|nr:hypothetical protein [Beggiatoa leptomitoformis]AUI70589.2 hypothetical protein BLE401_10065 [Beggiatoa leptomitoformis]QGX03765.1 hypothetical protein AL038_19250 [Beggiatoa leptomitoformis]